MALEWRKGEVNVLYEKNPKGFMILFYGLVIWGVLFCGYYLFSGWSSDAEFQAKMDAHQQTVAGSR